MFPIDVTADERAAGFEVTEIENPQAHYMGQAEKIGAVVCQVGETDRVIKGRGADGGITYGLKRFANYGFDRPGTPPDWKLIRILSPEPRRAVEEARSLVGRDVDVKVITRVPPPPC